MGYIYIPANFRWTIEDVDHLNTIQGSNDFSLETLVGVHHAYYNNHPDFDGGLYLIDLLWMKLNNRYNINWNIDILKNIVRFSKDPQQTYMDVLNTITTNEMIADYGF